MKKIISAAALLSLFFASLPGLANPLYQQSFTLQPGWNAVFLNVQPDDDNPETEDDASPANVFASIVGLQQVWAWIEPDSSVQFVEDANEIGFNDPGWYGYVPAAAGPQASVVTNLYKVLGARPYLIKIDPDQQSSPQTFTVSGVPLNRNIRWVPDTFTLTGLAIDSTLSVGETPSFADFLAIPSVSNPPIFSLNPDGSWASLSKNSPAQAGRAYWIFNDGSFTQSGPLDIDSATLNGINFRDSVATRSFTLSNRGGQSLALSTSLSNALPLYYYAGENDDNGESLWPSVSQLAPSLAPGEGLAIKLGVDRSNINEARSSLFTLRGSQAEIHIPVYIEPSPPAYGLYVGSVTLREVSQANAEDAITTTPVASELSFRLLLHYAADGSLSLLKTVYMMAQKGSPDPVSGISPIGDTVLVTDETRLGDFATVQQAGGVGQGYRLSSPVFDFSASHKTLVCDGAVVLHGGECHIDLTLAENSPTHPMRHQYHPNHDGKLPNGQPQPASLEAYKREIWDIQRQLSFQFTPQNNSNLFVPLGQARGEFSEIIHGMHKKPIYLRGDFILERVVSIDELNPAADEVLP
ncbi:MAG: hypothetical protein KTR17_12570 [Cellvibrionaceae bacterium]|nr:hypothetical protein [Cellvibrionaceae bacterium]